MAEAHDAKAALASSWTGALAVAGVPSQVHVRGHGHGLEAAAELFDQVHGVQLKTGAAVYWEPTALKLRTRYVRAAGARATSCRWMMVSSGARAGLRAAVGPT